MKSIFQKFHEILDGKHLNDATRLFNAVPEHLRHKITTPEDFVLHL